MGLSLYLSNRILKTFIEVLGVIMYVYNIYNVISFFYQEKQTHFYLFHKLICVN